MRNEPLEEQPRSQAMGTRLLVELSYFVSSKVDNEGVNGVKMYLEHLSYLTRKLSKIA